jgi:hypothetical protein
MMTARRAPPQQPLLPLPQHLQSPRDSAGQLKNPWPLSPLTTASMVIKVTEVADQEVATIPSTDLEAAEVLTEAASLGDSTETATAASHHHHNGVLFFV